MKSFECKDCELAFNVKSSLRLHIKREHEGVLFLATNVIIRELGRARTSNSTPDNVAKP